MYIKVEKMPIPDIKEALEHFGYTECSSCVDTTPTCEIFKRVTKLAEDMKSHGKKEWNENMKNCQKVRMVLDYDPNFPNVLIQSFRD